MVVSIDGKRNKKLVTRRGNGNVVLGELCRFVVTKRHLSNTAKLSVCKFGPVHTSVYQFSEMTEKLLSQVQAAQMGLLRRVHKMTFSDKVRSCQIRKALNIASRDSNYAGSVMCSGDPRKDWRGEFCQFTRGWPKRRARTRLSDYFYILFGLWDSVGNNLIYTVF